MSAFAAVTQHSKSMSAQAVAAHWAASCSHGTGNTQLEVDFLSLQIFYSLQYGTHHIDDPAWEGAFLTKPGLTALETAFSTLLDRHAVERFPKPGGWGYTEWGIMNIYPRAPRSKQQLKVNEQMLFVSGVKHARWQKQKLKPVLERYNLNGKNHFVADSLLLIHVHIRGEICQVLTTSA